MNPRRILVINVSRIGDTLLCTPALRTLAYAVGFASMVSFLVVAWGVGGYSASIEHVMVMDGTGIAALAGAAVVDRLGPSSSRA